MVQRKEDEFARVHGARRVKVVERCGTKVKKTYLVTMTLGLRKSVYRAMIGMR